MSRRYASAAAANHGRRRGPQRQRGHDAGPVAKAAAGVDARATNSDSIPIGAEVLVVQKHDQPTGRETRGVVARLLTNKPHHPRGIKVALTTGEVGRVARVVNAGEKIVANTGVGPRSRLEDDDDRPSAPGPTLLADFVDLSSSETTRKSKTTKTKDERRPVDADARVVADDAHLATLVGMDFDPATAAEALARRGNDLERALEDLLSS